MSREKEPSEGKGAPLTSYQLSALVGPKQEANSRESSTRPGSISNQTNHTLGSQFDSLFRLLSLVSRAQASGTLLRCRFLFGIEA